jgi:hypothetical protein
MGWESTKKGWTVLRIKIKIMIKEIVNIPQPWRLNVHCGLYSKSPQSFVILG